MSLIEYQSSERGRQVAQWQAARARIAAAAIVKPKLVKLVEKPVEIEQAKPVFPTVPMFVPPGERDFLEVASMDGNIRQYSIGAIAKEVRIQFKVHRAEFESVRKQTNVMLSRQVAMVLSKHLTQRSFPEIGRRIGGRDHTTVLHACRKWAPVLAACIDKVPETAPVSVWVENFRAEMEITPAARNPKYTRKTIDPAKSIFSVC